jgi:tripartite-type tricarboxylate transporter receptor subunit TctC
MLKTHAVLSAIVMGLATVAADTVRAQIYPAKPIRIATGSVGSSGDFIARLIAQGLSGPLGQQVIVENRAAGLILITTAAKAPPDGYTLLLYTNGLWITPLLESVPWDPLQDFSPIAMTHRSPSIVVVHPSLPVKSVKDLITLAKSRPGELNYAAAGIGGSTHLSVELFKAMAGVNIAYIPYKGSGLAIIDLISGHVQLMFATAGSVTSHVKSGRLKGLAVTSARPSELVPGLPTVAASGVPEYEAVSIFGAFAPAKTPAPIIARLNQEIISLLARTDIKEKFLNAGVETVGSSPEQFTATIKSEVARLGKVIKDAGIRVAQ